MKPLARADGLVVRDVADEVLVYDLQRNEAHALNGTAALVWRHCDGRKTLEELQAAVEQELQISISQEVIPLALGQLARTHLLQEPAVIPGAMVDLSRREFVRRAGVAAAVLTPIIASIVAPMAAHAASVNAACPNGESDCNSGICAGNNCCCRKNTSPAGTCCVKGNNPCRTTAECCGNNTCQNGVCTGGTTGCGSAV